jgi:hypothetical protein
MAKTEPIDPLEAWRAYADSLAWAKGSLDASAYNSLVRAASLGVRKGVALDAVLARIAAGGYAFPKGKLERQLSDAYAYVGERPPPNGTTAAIPAKDSWPSRNAKLLDSIVLGGEYPALYDLWERSPVRFDDDQSHTEWLIDRLFPGNSYLCVGESNSKFWTQRRRMLCGALSKMQFIVPHPMIAPKGITQQGHSSAHSKANTGELTYLVIECDFDARSPEWRDHIARWKKADLEITDACASILAYLDDYAPLTLAVYSAGKSVHGWFNAQGVDAEIIRRFVAKAYSLGADLATYRNRSQFVRMPDGKRDNGKRQSVFYFNPKYCVKRNAPE